MQNEVSSRKIVESFCLKKLRNYSSCKLEIEKCAYIFCLDKVIFVCSPNNYFSFGYTSAFPDCEKYLFSRFFFQVRNKKRHENKSKIRTSCNCYRLLASVTFICKKKPIPYHFPGNWKTTAVWESYWELTTPLTVILKGINVLRTIFNTIKNDREMS